MNGERNWMIVRKSRSIPGGWSVVKYGLSREQAERHAASYKRPVSVMAEPELMRLRLDAMGLSEGQR